MTKCYFSDNLCPVVMNGCLVQCFAAQLTLPFHCLPTSELCPCDKLLTVWDASGKLCNFQVMHKEEKYELSFLVFRPMDRQGCSVVDELFWGEWGCIEGNALRMAQSD